MSRRLVAIVGPTASGKSAAAVALARRLGGEILNGDSRQIYRGMDVGTAKPPAAVRAQVRHHLYDIIEPTETYSLALYQRDARATLEDIWSRGSVPWLVGGTGQYVWSVLEDWRVPEVAPNEPLRTRLTTYAGEAGATALHARLAGFDPVAAGRIDPRNVRRVVRAIEVFEATGTPISQWQAKGTPDFESLVIGVAMGREQLHAHIAQRAREMFACGLCAEVQKLLDAGVPRNAPAMSSIGYAETVRHLDGEISILQAEELTRLATQRLAKRQYQWFRPSDERVHWLPTIDEMEVAAAAFLSG